MHERCDIVKVVVLFFATKKDVNSKSKDLWCRFSLPKMKIFTNLNLDANLSLAFYCLFLSYSFSITGWDQTCHNGALTSLKIFLWQVFSYEKICLYQFSHNEGISRNFQRFQHMKILCFNKCSVASDFYSFKYKDKRNPLLDLPRPSKSKISRMKC